MVEADEKTIRQYLLGELDEAEMVRFEERLMTDDELFEMLRVVEDDLIDEAAARELSAEEQAHFDRNFLATPDRRARLELSFALHDYARRVAPVIRPLRSPRFYLGLAAAAILLIAVGFVGWPLIAYRLDVSRGIAALNKAYAENPTDARITGLNYPPRPTERGGSEPGKINKLELEQARGWLASAASKHPNAITYHAVGRLYLAERDFDSAVQYLGEAVKLDEKNADLHSDLGAALLEKGKVERTNGESGKSFEAFAQSNEHLSRALELQSSLLEALFNRALCREFLRLYDLAKEDWENYIKQDSNSKWANEARQRLKELQERPPTTSQNLDQLFQDFLNAYRAKDDERGWKLICQSRDAAGDFIESRLIDDYLDLAANGHNDAAKEKLAALSYAGKLRYKQAGDRFIADLWRFYQSATPSQRESTLQGRNWMKRGRERMAGLNFDEALDAYKKARASFERAGDEAEALYTTYPMGNCYVQQSEPESALSVFQPLAQACEKAQYRGLLGQTLNATANAYQYLRAFSAALDNTNRSLKLAEAMRDMAGYVRTAFQLADEYRFLNNFRKALDLHVQNLSLAYTYLPQPAELWRNYFSISLTFYELDLYTTAIDFQKQALRLTLEAERPRLACRCYNFLGMLLAKRGEYAEAAVNIERALEIGNAFTERRIRLEATAYSFLQLGYIYNQLGDFSQAIANYDQAIQIYGDLPSPFFNYLARKDKLRCCIEQGGCDSVGPEMETLLDLFEAHRSKILEESNRSTFFDAEQNIYDLAIGFEYDKKGDAQKAFEYSERSRGRSLHDLINMNIQIVDDPNYPDMKYSDGSQSMSLETIQSRMPEQAQILQYAVLKNRILIWVVSHNDGLRVASRSIPIEDLNKRVNRFLQRLASADEMDFEAFSSEAADLYDLLIQPVRDWLDRNKPLCIVPDKVLNYLPFAALKSRASKQYFIEEQERGFVLSPSSTLFVICSENAGKKELLEGEKLLSVGDPLFDHQTFADLGKLAAAAREAETITGYYRSPRLLLGASATKCQVMSEMEEADVIHLATHAVTDQWYPLRSKLLLAKDAQGGEADGILQAYEIYMLNLERARLVVLSACRTGVEKYYGGEGMVGLARPFIAKRIPLVVASLWPVNSASTADLMISFHGYRKSGRGMSTAEALRRAQIDMLRDTDSDNHLPYHWAAFVAIGGHANF